MSTMTEGESREETEPSAVRRSRLGTSAALWSAGGAHRVEPGWWEAMSGVRSVDFNMLLCHGSDPALVTRSLELVAESKDPAVITLAGPGLANAQVLVDAGWVCIGTSPFMVLREMGSRGFEADPDVTEAGPDELPGVWEAVREAFGLTPALARIAIPENVLETPGQRLWILAENGALRSCVATVQVDAAIAVWSMATPPAWQGHGYGRRLLTTALALTASTGADESILQASPAGEPLYRALGYDVTEHWQMWSRPRWVFGRS
jgi:GNAT superfamily N-acetyltransferase